MPDKQRTWIDAVVEDCRRKIHEHGFTVIGVGADPQGAMPQFAYTVGVSVTRGFELVMSGLPIETMHTALNTLARRALDDPASFTPTSGLLIEGVFTAPFQPRMMPVHGEWPFGMIRKTLGPVRPGIWQAQFPDVGGRYPGEADYCLGAAKQTDFTRPKPSAATAAAGDDRA